MIQRNTGIKCLFSKRVKEKATLEQILSEGESGLRFKDNIYHQEFVRKELHSSTSGDCLMILSAPVIGK